MSTSSPFTPLGLSASFGFGDRLGLATPGHVTAMQRSAMNVLPIFAQQSIREMTRTRRSPQNVIDDALRGVRAAGYAGAMGADADHLKTPGDVDVTVAAGFCFFTIDPSADVDGEAARYDTESLAAKFNQVEGEAPWLDRYAGASIDLETGTRIDFDEITCRRAAVKYARVINAAISLANHIDRVMRGHGREYEIELSVDETPEPTTLAEHYIIAGECLRNGMKLLSLAPRFIGDFEKGVDYKGDVAALERSLADHAAIARRLGPYKLSLHSGSDKISIYPALALATKGQFHIKTAGTSYLEGLRVVARHEPKLFRRAIDLARSHYEKDRATYHVSARLESVPEAAQIPDPIDLERVYLDRWNDVPSGRGFTAPGRQILHTTYGSVLNAPEIGSEIIDVVRGHSESYREILAEHFARHVAALRIDPP